MGAWGTSLYANDTTADVRDTYMGFLRDQLSNEEAYKKTILEFNELIGDEDEEPFLWFALAETQWKVGRLTPEVKGKALEWIAKGGSASLWQENEKNYANWKKTLEKLKATLESPMRSEKKIRKPVVLNHNMWERGDVYAYQFHEEESKAEETYGKYIIMQKMGAGPRVRENKWITQEELSGMALSETTEPLFMLVHTFDKLYDNLPTLADLEGVRLLPVTIPYESKGIVEMSLFLELYKKKDYPKEYLFYLGKAPVSADNRIWLCYTPIYWHHLEGKLSRYLLKWQGVEYEEIEEGVYEYSREEKKVR